jgi:hypothetical protein
LLEDYEMTASEHNSKGGSGMDEITFEKSDGAPLSPINKQEQTTPTKPKKRGLFARILDKKLGLGS